MPERDRLIFHVDVNSAYLSWEAVYRLNILGETTDLRDIPSAVGGSIEQRHGIIFAKSGPARQFGIKTAETVNGALKKCPELLIVPPRRDWYNSCSKAFMTLIQEYTPRIEKFSIDEAFMDMTDSRGFSELPEETARKIKDRIKNELGFTVNIGISTNKLLAKMASDFKKPDLVHTLYPEEIPRKMWPLPVSELFMAGKATVNTLHKLGISTIGGLACADREILISHLNKHGGIIHDYANGIDNTPVMDKPPDNKGYGNSVTISHDVTDIREAREILAQLCSTVSRRLKKDGVHVGVISVVIKNNLLLKNSRQCTLVSPTDAESELRQHACRLFEEAWDHTPIRLLGIQTSKVTRDRSEQLDLFHMKDYARQAKLEKALEEIQSRFGPGSIMPGSSFPKKDQ